ncbi:MATE family efflux transporter [Lentilactobacillus sp. Marseille-Q4993]|uniref:MATE family efflux transporter n=1 Tax=Lentilactobacillus sp. Marseille-Q4993 TaxID=3039492 RepID=UPI0024BC44A6|nr:MATE family efflux transporter [Lentilactobacillus sp. Marseille-Q4993]
MYTIVSFLGIPANILFNYTASILRSFGDSIHPLHFLIISLIINIILDVLFIKICKMDVSGAAWATVISEFIGGILNTILIFKSNLFINNPIRKMNFSVQHFNKMIIIGLPMGLEYSVSAIGAIIMQGAINSMGPSIIAAQSSADKIRQLFTLPMESVGAAIATYQAQNFGARQIKRMRDGIYYGSIIQIVYSIISFTILIFSANTLSKLLIGNIPNVISYSEKYLFIISFFFPFHGLLMIFRNTLQGWGHSIIAILSGLGELIGRGIGSLLAVSTFGYTAICLSNPLAWGISLAYCFIMVIILLKKHQSE